jgi:signal transduction histidine kinase
MFLKKRFNLRHTLAFRLTLWYAGIFALSLCTAFLFFYLFISSVFKDGTDQELVSRTQELDSLLQVNGIEAVKRVVVLEAQAAGEKKIFVRLFYPNGTTFSSSNMSYWKDISISKNAVDRIVGGSVKVFETITIPNRKHNVRILYSVISPGVLLQLGQSLETHTRFIEAFQKIFIITMTALVLFAGFIGWFMAKRATTGVEAVTKTARHISEGALEQRVPVNTRGDEIDQLALTFNQMLDRIQTLVKNIKEMSDNIAHDLKSPVTRIRGMAEITLTTGKTMAEYESMAAGTIEECDRLLDMINTMLVISKTEAGVDHMDQGPVDLVPLVNDACDLFLPLAEDKGVELTFKEKTPCVVWGNTPMIQRMMANLIDNALKYSPPGKTVDLSITRPGNGQVNLLVTDRGIGIANEDLPHILRRLYTGHPTKNPTGPGGALRRPWPSPKPPGG